MLARLHRGHKADSREEDTSEKLLSKPGQLLLQAEGQVSQFAFLTRITRLGRGSGLAIKQMHHCKT